MEKHELSSQTESSEPQNSGQDLLDKTILILGVTALLVGAISFFIL